jgi:hypothetical protein
MKIEGMRETSQGKKMRRKGKEVKDGMKEMESMGRGEGEMEK